LKAIIILNPNAHSGETPQRVNAIRDEIGGPLREVLQLDALEWSETEHVGHAVELAARAVHDGFDYVFAGGGDGTINEVLNGIMRAGTEVNRFPIMGVLPFGTSNDFFAALIEAENAGTEVDQARHTVALDVGHASFDGVERYFCLTTGMGLFSWANEQYLDASRTFTRRFAHIPAAIATVLSYRFHTNVKISLNGNPARVRRVMSIIVDNSPIIAGGTPLTPDALLNDGLLDVCIFKRTTWPRLIYLMIQVRRKAHTQSTSMALGRIHEMTVTARDPLPVQVDGELVPEIDSKARHMAIKVLPKALQIVLPSVCKHAMRDPKPADTVTTP
jgi:YegS/Rv2252/BmrU family lipid kinase